MNEEMLINEAAYTQSEIEQYNEELSNKILNVEGGMEAAEDNGMETAEEHNEKEMETAEDYDIETANSLSRSSNSEEIAEYNRTQNENYEEFASDFEETDEKASQYADIEDESAADAIEAAQDEYFNEEKGYESTADYTMISEEETSGS